MLIMFLPMLYELFVSAYVVTVRVLLSVRFCTVSTKTAMTRSPDIAITTTIMRTQKR